LALELASKKETQEDKEARKRRLLAPHKHILVTTTTGTPLDYQGMYLGMFVKSPHPLCSADLEKKTVASCATNTKEHPRPESTNDDTAQDHKKEPKKPKAKTASWATKPTPVAGSRIVDSARLESNVKGLTPEALVTQSKSASGSSHTSLPEDGHTNMHRDHKRKTICDPVMPRRQRVRSTDSSAGSGSADDVDQGFDRDGQSRGALGLARRKRALSTDSSVDDDGEVAPRRFHNKQKSIRKKLTNDVNDTTFAACENRTAKRYRQEGKEARLRAQELGITAAPTVRATQKTRSKSTKATP